jgi:hypothetical protein
MRALRRRGLQRPQWTLNAFIQQRTGPDPLPFAWVSRIVETQRRFADLARRPQAPLDWAELVPLVAGDCRLARPTLSIDRRVPGRPPFSPGRRSRRLARIRWPPHLWADFLSILARTLDETLFAPESQDAPIQIAGPAESAGLIADAVWFLGASEDAWPSAAPLTPSCRSRCSARQECRTPPRSSTGIWRGHHRPSVNFRPGGSFQLRKANRRHRRTPVAPDRPACRRADQSCPKRRQPGRTRPLFLSKTSAAFHSRPARFLEAPVCSPPSPSAPSRPSPPPAWRARLGASGGRPDPSAAWPSSFTRCFTPSGAGRRMASASQHELLSIHELEAVCHPSRSRACLKGNFAAIAPAHAPPLSGTRRATPHRHGHGVAGI